MKIYTRTGDKGTSALPGGTRKPKADPLFAALGALDEANSALGLAASFCPPQSALAPLIERLQHNVFDLGAALADPSRAPDLPTARLEEDIDRLDADLPPLTAFILPGGDQAAAALHLARSFVRRAERTLAALAQKDALENIPENIHAASFLPFVNRLSDLLFVLARAANKAAGRKDVIWQQLA